METKSNSLSDFIESRDAINQIISKKDEFFLINFNSGVISSEDIRNSPYPVLSLRIQMSFVVAAEASQLDKEFIIRPFEKSVPIPIFDPNSILAAINLISIGSEIIKSTEEPCLIYIASETTSGINFRGGRTEYLLSICVDSVTADQYDEIKRKPVNVETLKEILKGSIVDG